MHSRCRFASLRVFRSRPVTHSGKSRGSGQKGALLNPNLLALDGRTHGALRHMAFPRPAHLARLELHLLRARLSTGYHIGGGADGEGVSSSPVPTPRRDSHHGPLPGDMPKEKTDPRDKPGPVPPSSGQGKTGTGFQQWPKNLKKGITFPRRRRRRSRHRRRRTRRPRTHRTRPRTAGSRERSAQRSLACSSRAAPRRPGG